MIHAHKAVKYMDIAHSIAQMSKDQKTKVGALIIGPDGEGGPWGYNGIPRNMDDGEWYRHQQPFKTMFFEHAERNAIYTAARTGYQTINCTLVVTKFPCADCARAIIQCGFKRIITVPADAKSRTWAASQTYARLMFDEAGIEVQILETLL
jgi:dCMP deaminase